MRDVEHARRYAEISKRLSRITTIGAVVVTALQSAALWGEWERIGILIGLQAALTVYNTWITFRVLPRHGMRAEVARTIVNMTSVIAVVYFVGWTLPVWLWMPFVALSFD